MEIKINKKMDCEIYDAILDVKFANEKRKEILAFLMFVDERGEVSTADVNKEFLMQNDGNHPYGKRYIELMIGYEFLEDGGSSFRLTKEATEMVADGEVMLPERGDYRICISNDPVFDHPVIGITHGRNLKKGKDKRPENPNKVSEKELEALKKEWEKEMLYLPLSEKKAIIDMVEVCEKLPNERYDMTATLTEKGSRVNIKKDDVSKTFVTQSIPEFNSVLIEIAKKVKMPYNAKEDCVEVNEENLENIKDGFLIDLPPAEIDIPKFGKYSALPTKDVPCMPDNESTAVEWVRLLVNKNIRNRYTTKSQFNDMVVGEARNVERWYSASNITKKINYHTLLANLKERSETRDEMYWHIVAANDLFPEGSI